MVGLRVCGVSGGVVQENTQKKTLMVRWSLCSGVCWLVFTERGCAGWFLRSEGALAGFYAGRVCWLVFIERGCAGWFLANQGALAGFPRHIENMEEFNRNMKELNGN